MIDIVKPISFSIVGDPWIVIEKLNSEIFAVNDGDATAIINVRETPTHPRFTEISRVEECISASGSMTWVSGGSDLG